MRTKVSMVVAGAGALALGFFGVAASAQAQTMACGQSGQTLEGPPGTTFTVTCAPGCAQGSVWGTDIYSDDSDVCTAAIHAGALGPDNTVQVIIEAGLNEYTPSARNGVQTSAWAAWPRSFRFPNTGGLSCDENAQGIEAEFGMRVTVTCPSGCVDGGTVWGNGVYTDDSSICTAAVHAGAISNAEGGPVVIEMTAGLDEHPASTQNGVETQRWGSWARAFRVIDPDM